jgi:hypothetical protein
LSRTTTTPRNASPKRAKSVGTPDSLIRTSRRNRISLEEKAPGTAAKGTPNPNPAVASMGDK